MGMRDQLLEQSGSSGQGADYPFALPAASCKALTGLRHDEGIDGVDRGAFLVLERSSRGWCAIIFQPLMAT